MTTVHELVYEEAKRGLDLQRDALDALRTRAGTMLAAAALVTTFLGGQALEGKGDPTSLEWWAIGAFIGVAVLTIVVLLPWKFDFSLQSSTLVGDYIDSGEETTPEEVLRNFALYHDEAQTHNKPKLTILQWSFRIAAALLGFEVVAWLIAL